MEYEDYKDLEDGLSNLPTTWYPALIQKMVKVAYDKRVFKKGGASIFIAKSVEDIVLTTGAADGEGQCECGKDKTIFRANEYSKE